MVIVNNLVAMSLWFTAILGLGALSGLFSEKGGIVNIAINGVMIFGALIYAILKKYIENGSGYMQIPAFLIVALAGAIFAMLHAFASINLKANQVISGTAINLLSAGIAIFVIKVVFKMQDGIPSQFKNLTLGENNLDWKFGIAFPVIMAFTIFVLAFVFLHFTRLGMRIKAAGDNPQALEAQGISVIRIRYIAVMISGSFAALAGSVFAQLIKFQGNVQGLGFVALAILIFGQWKIPFVVIGSIIFSALNTFGSVTPILSDAPVFLQDNKDLISAIPFVASLVILAFTSKNSKAPRAAGIPYDKSKR